MAEKKWTTEQLQAITERGRNILVSAGAGSGKTAVMVERATRLILDDHVPVSAMLIVTFTNAAAAEMRERLRQALKGRLSAAIASGEQDAAPHSSSEHGEYASERGADPGYSGGVSAAGARGQSEQEWIRSQLDELHSAQISTFHSFAQRVIKEFFYLTDLEPGARVLDEAEAEVLKEEALEELFDSEYEEKSEDFIAFLDSYSGEKNDGEARQLILALYRKLEAIPNGLNVLDEKTKELELDAEGFVDTEAYAELKKLCRKYFHDALESAAAAESVLGNEGLERLGGIVREDAAQIRDAAEMADIDDMAAAVRGTKFAIIKARKDEKEAYDLVKDVVKAFREDYKGRMKAVTELCYTDLGTMTKVLRMTAPYARTIARLVRKFDGLFREIKNDHKGIDYSDMEHFAYEILGHKEAADYYRELFRYIFIDEYQDTNYMQETIVSMIARPDNLFMVGDIKQSIYHFRLADPEIFQNKYDEYKGLMKSAGGREGCPVKIDLNRNFRSKAPVIDEINKMFRPLMDGYDEDAELICGVEQGEHALYGPRTYIVDRAEADEEGQPDDAVGASTAADGQNGGAAAASTAADALIQAPADAEIEDIKKEELEAREAVQIIRENLGKEFTDPKSGETRKVDYRDIVILMRSFRRSAEGYRKMFREAGIPLYIDDKDGYFDTIEINVALALLSVIDNKRQDVPFIALLRSEIFGFSCEELALIRKLHMYGSYVEAAEYAAGIAAYGGTEPGDGTGARQVVPESLRKKCRHVFDEIKKWQTYAVTLPLADMIWRILNETGYYVITGTFPGGAGRQANLRLLCDRARDYSERSLGSLYGFIRYIDTLKKNQVEMPQATLFSENENVVRIMTIHHSKGLEFPVVILAGMDNQPKGGGSAVVDFDREIGLGLRAKDPVRHLKEDSIVQRIIAAKEKQAETDELKRVYYVAVTRARETFYLLGAADYERIMAGFDAGQHSDSTLLRMSRYLPEVVHVSGKELLSKPLAIGGVLSAAGGGGKTLPAREVSREEVIARLDYEYPYAAAGELSAKTSVTGLNKAKMRAVTVTGPGEESDDSGKLLDPDVPGLDDQPAESSSFCDIVPDFIRGRQKITAAETGTVYHKIMEKLDFRRAGSEGYKYIAGRAAELVKAGLFSEEEIKTTDLGKIADFFGTDIGKRCIAAHKAGTLYKEQSFESKIKISGEDVLVQGVIDCWFEEDGEEVLIDYKTNRIDRSKSLDEEKARIREMYRTQLEMYADAIEKATGKRVKEKYLYLFAIGESVEV